MKINFFFKKKVTFSRNNELKLYNIKEIVTSAYFCLIMYRKSVCCNWINNLAMIKNYNPNKTPFPWNEYIGCFWCFKWLTLSKLIVSWLNFTNYLVTQSVESLSCDGPDATGGWVTQSVCIILVLWSFCVWIPVFLPMQFYNSSYIC